MGIKQNFGGGWTNQKLEKVRQYLAAYTQILSKKSFDFAYIDAFAGTGYREVKTKQTHETLLFPELAHQDSQKLLDGSARIALRIQPPFTRYIFIEKEQKRFEQLEKLRAEFPDLASRISLVNEDCNTYLQDRCKHYNWKKHRAVLFLDPFGMQVQWDTMQAIAGTKAIDVWILFPLGVAVNRLLKRDGKIIDSWATRLDSLFGTHSWYGEFYKQGQAQTLFNEPEYNSKTCKMANISRFYVERLKTIFAAVHENPLPLCNSKGNPLFQLCFAASNPNAAKLALKIVTHIVRE